MENNQESYIEDIKIDIKEIHDEIEEKKEDLISKLNSEQVKVADVDTKEDFGEFIGDLFYNSVKNFFDIGFKLAKNLNLEFLTQDKQQVKKQKKD